MHPKALLLAAFLASPAAALAGEQDGAVAQPPALEHGKAATADATPVDPGVLELEVAYAPAVNNRGGSSGFERSEPGHAQALLATVTWGVVADVDVKLAAGFASVYDASGAGGAAPTRGAGIGDAVAGARWRFLSLPERALELAVTGEAVIPVGTRQRASEIGLSQEYWSARGALVATKDVGLFSINGEVALGAPISGDAGGLRSVLQANLAAGYHLREWLQPELELNYQSSVGVGSQVLAATAGIVAPFGAGQRIVAAVQQGIWGRNAAQTTAAVLAFKTAL